MILKGKTAVIHGGSGAIGSAIAGTFLREGAKVYLVGRNPDRLASAAERLRNGGGVVETAAVDVLDDTAVASHAASVAKAEGGIDIAVNATSFMHDQGSLIDTLSLADFMEPIDRFLRSLFNTAKAVTPHMGGERGGVILSLTAPAGRMMLAGHMGHVVSCAGIESLTRCLAADLGPRNIRAVCIRPHGISDAPEAGSYAGQLFDRKTREMGITLDQFMTGMADTTLLNRLPTLTEVAETALFLASPAARSMTGTTVNLTAGATMD
ncbi:SDR family oxidoreductase [Ciceribacter sp. L1K23]|uniref:SDR family NAD(P)-dependent oxidoreductase n=1 Tax=Ciceribacter sp. L1K23 TaxID=2820276 RepID=UPI001B83774A|nr:SDR family oxidoreductase [Ciceribacter sp. L1K23]MBR0556430.1 SDR family oxidoreductase [Ciceribacter sp. L1K23]